MIDALRQDFVFSEQSQMKKIQQLILQDKVKPFVAFAHPPTVTMPRIKVPSLKLAVLAHPFVGYDVWQYSEFY